MINENMTPCPICSKPMVVLNPKGYCCDCLLKELKGTPVGKPKKPFLERSYK